jgi:hypothetical protein
MSSPTGYVSPTDFRIPLQPPTISADYSQKQMQQIMNVLWNTIQQLISSLVTDCGIGPRNAADWPALEGSAGTLLQGNLGRLYVPTSETVQSGGLVNLYNDNGILTARNANAINNTRPAVGFCSLSALEPGSIGEVVLGMGLCSGDFHLDAGIPYYLSSTVSGTVQAVKPVAAGNIEQFVGFGMADGSLFFNANYWIQH